MSKEYPCVYYDNEKCKHFSGEGVTSYCVLGPCSHETPSNADRIRAMTDEELARFLIGVYIQDYWDHPNDIRDWLKQPKEGADHEI